MRAFQRRSRLTGDEAAPTESTESDACESNAIARQLRRRRAASQRLVPLDCGCRDPWPCRCTFPAITEKALDGWRDAAVHILQPSADAVPALPIEVLRALYRRGGTDRALAEELHELTGGAVA